MSTRLHTMKLQVQAEKSSKRAKLAKESLVREERARSKRQGRRGLLCESFSSVLRLCTERLIPLIHRFNEASLIRLRLCLAKIHLLSLVSETQVSIHNWAKNSSLIKCEKLTHNKMRDH